MNAVHSQSTRSHRPRRRMQRLVNLMGLLGVIGISGCTQLGQASKLGQYLDEQTGVTVTQVSEPLVFYREDWRVAANQRNYIYVAPLEIDRMGHRSYWLWFGVWTMIDYVGAQPEEVPPDHARVILLLDGEPMELEGVVTSPRQLGLVREPYQTPVDDALAMYFPLAASQLTRISRTDVLSVRMFAGGIAGKEYSLWRDQLQQLKDFAAYAEGGREQLPVALSRR